MNLPSDLTDIFMTLRYVSKSVIKKLSGTFIIYSRGQEDFIPQRSSFRIDFVWLLVCQLWHYHRFSEINQWNANKVGDIDAVERSWLNFGQFNYKIHQFLVIRNAKLCWNLSWSFLASTAFYLKAKPKHILRKLIEKQ